MNPFDEVHRDGPPISPLAFVSSVLRGDCRAVYSPFRRQRATTTAQPRHMLPNVTPFSAWELGLRNNDINRLATLPRCLTFSSGCVASFPCPLKLNFDRNQAAQDKDCTIMSKRLHKCRVHGTTLRRPEEYAFISIPIIYSIPIIIGHPVMSITSFPKRLTESSSDGRSLNPRLDWSCRICSRTLLSFLNGSDRDNIDGCDSA